MIDDTIKKDNQEQDNNIVDINLGFVEKKKFRINGDFNRMLELNVSDLNVFARLKEGYPKLKELLLEAQAKIESIPDDGDDEGEMIAKNRRYSHRD